VLGLIAVPLPPGKIHLKFNQIIIIIIIIIIMCFIDEQQFDALMNLVLSNPQDIIGAHRRARGERERERREIGKKRNELTGALTNVLLSEGLAQTMAGTMCLSSPQPNAIKLHHFYCQPQPPHSLVTSLILRMVLELVSSE
jgi:hypothetical protein